MSFVTFVVCKQEGKPGPVPLWYSVFVSGMALATGVKFRVNLAYRQLALCRSRGSMFDKRGLFIQAHIPQLTLADLNQGVPGNTLKAQEPRS